MEYEILYPAGVTKESFIKQPLPGRNAWLAALRSGKYKQTIGVLCSESGSCCCLGVKCIVDNLPSEKCAGVSGGIEFDGSAWTISERNPNYRYLGLTGNFPPGVEVRLFGCTPSLDRRVFFSELAQCNDAGLLFAQIADIIESLWCEPS